MYDIEFEDLFEDKREAVVSYLSLEKRYIELKKNHKEYLDDPEGMISKNCTYCGGDQRVAEIAKMFGHRPDAAFLQVRKLEDKIEALEDHFGKDKVRVIMGMRG